VRTVIKETLEAVISLGGQDFLERVQLAVILEDVL